MKNDRGKYGDGYGLWLIKDSKVTGRWAFRYMRNGKAHELGLGSIHTISLSKAREKAKQLRELQVEKLDPLEERRATAARKKIEEAAAVTFRQFAEEYIASHRAEWSNLKHEKQWTQSLEAYAFPLIGDLPIAAVDTDAVKAVLLQKIDGVPFWNARPETASRVRSRIEKILGAAKISGKAKGDNPARWEDYLEHVFTSRAKTEKGEKRHLAAMPFAQLPSFMQALREQEGTVARLLEFTILTAARTEEARSLPFSEIDFPNRVWTIDARRMKNRKEHRVPLPDRAVAILEALKADSAGKYVFAGPGDRPVSDKAMRRLLAVMGQSNYTVHGFRTSFTTWVADCTECATEVRKAAVSHAVGDATEAAYQRGSFFDRRRKLMDDWCRFCSGAEPSFHSRAQADFSLLGAA